MPRTIPPPARAAAHYDGVQALRFFAARAVVLLHANFYVGQRLTDQPVSLWTGGAWGVEMPVPRWMKRVFSASLSAKPQAAVAARS